jgi:hypothetical protein
MIASRRNGGRKMTMDKGRERWGKNHGNLVMAMVKDGEK